ncbi:MAG: protein-methionine-sulfoxide reductase heme-binding subunit MsrQ [Gammaproteobacteria bacterium]|nr:MAG: protein-methionine-sulfoxide reductase heme-binding subunit MsrQ [Gammaproteobacteria bacterium]
MKTKTKIWLLKVAIHLSALIPIVNLYHNAFTDQLGADPVEAVIHYTGIGAFNLLLITLCISPLAKLVKQSFLMNIRRLLGLYAFTYALLHLFNFIVFDLQLDFSLLLSEIIKRPYITIGMIAFLLLFMLAITSINSLKRKLGKRWQKLHNFSYVILLLVGVHFYWSVKSEVSEPLIYFAISVFLLAVRRQKIQRWLTSKR